MIRVTFLDTGEERDFRGVLMVAPNGMLFIKDGKRTVFATNNPQVMAEEL